MELEKIADIWHFSPDIDVPTFFLSIQAAELYRDSLRELPKYSFLSPIFLSSVSLSSYEPDAKIVRLDDLHRDKCPQTIPPGLAHTGDIIVISLVRSNDIVYVPTSDDVVKYGNGKCIQTYIAPVFGLKRKVECEGRGSNSRRH